MTETDLTPLMRQYWEIKASHREAIVFFRVGDFYEMFFEDAEVASQLLNIALTSRDKHRADPVPLCGVPHHAAMTYIGKLLKAGKTVALCDQVEDPKSAKGLVRREVVRVYTPGTLVDAELLPPDESIFLAALALAERDHSRAPRPIGLAALDTSTGQFWTAELSGPDPYSAVQNEILRLEPRELLYPHDLPPDAESLLQSLGGLRLCRQDRQRFDSARCRRVLQEHFGVVSLEGFGCEALTTGVQAAGAILQYIRETQPTLGLSHISCLKVRRTGDAMHLDAATVRNLELVKPLVQDRQDATLLRVLDHTTTVMGSRLLREWILHPLIDPAAIQLRLDAVEQLVERLETRTRIRAGMREVQDVARLSSRVTMGVAGPRDLIALKRSIRVLPELRKLLGDLSRSLFQNLHATWDDLADVHDLIDSTLLPDAPLTAREGGTIRDGYHAELDELRTLARDGKGLIARLEAEERSRTGIDTLKIRFNHVFGYYIEVSKSHVQRVPDRFSRRQTLANAERFSTPELKELEDKVMGADAKLVLLEQELFQELRSRIGERHERLQWMSTQLALLDVIASLAEAAAKNRYIRPEILHGRMLTIADGRHPVVEQLTPPGSFIPNDTILNDSSHRLVILTGPNMAGKSTYLRQIALIVLMAQMGSFVPAQAATIGVVDRIFTRVGASDNLAGGQSTFMVEMTETAQILTNATEQSLILLDEIGRGTSTYDGLSIAWAVAEYILDPTRLGARTLFATHYHEMTELAERHAGARNYTVLVKERDEEVIFLRKIVEGGADRSYGIHVARLAGLPTWVIKRAKEVLLQLESTTPSSRDDQQVDETEDALPRPHPVIEEVRQMELFSMTPLEALNRLADLQRRLDQQA